MNCDRINLLLHPEKIKPHYIYYTLQDIQKAILTPDNKVKALALYESSFHYDLYTVPWTEVMEEIGDIMKTQPKDKTEEELILNSEKDYNDSRKFMSMDDYKKKILLLEAPKEAKATLYGMYHMMMSKTSTDSSSNDMKEKLYWALQLPFDKKKPMKDIGTSKETFFEHVASVLDSQIYGMIQVKEKVLQVLNDRLTNPNGKTQPILALKGKPGVGKTYVAEAIAVATTLPFQKINLGGCVDSTIFKGSDNVWSGASPSLLLQLIARSGYNNPVILLDEVDKLSENMKGLSVQHALLHVLDPLQNKSFQDGFLNEMNHDISNVWFILSMNDDTTLDPALKDRIEIIEIEDYTQEEKVKILEQYTLPSLLKEKGLEKEDITFTKDALRFVVQTYNEENSGMRCLKRIMNDILSKISLWNSVSIKQRESFQFSVPDFKGYPYIIKEASISKLIQKTTKPSSYKSMYT